MKPRMSVSQCFCLHCLPSSSAHRSAVPEDEEIKHKTIFKWVNSIEQKKERYWNTTSSQRNVEFLTSIKLSWIETLVSKVYKEWLSNEKKREKRKKENVWLTFGELVNPILVLKYATSSNSGSASKNTGFLTKVPKERPNSIKALAWMRMSTPTSEKYVKKMVEVRGNSYSYITFHNVLGTTIGHA